METRTPDLGTLLHAGTRPRPGLPTRVPEPDNGRGFPTAQPADGSKYISTWYSRPTVAFTLGAVTGALKCSPKTLPCMLKQAAIALRYGYTNKFGMYTHHATVRLPRISLLHAPESVVPVCTSARVHFQVVQQSIPRKTERDRRVSTVEDRVQLSQLLHVREAMTVFGSRSVTGL